VANGGNCISCGFTDNIGGVATDATYPAVYQLADDSFGYFYREGNHADDWVFTTSADGNSFSNKQAVLNANSTESWYANGKVGPDGNFYAVFGYHQEKQANSGEPRHSHLRENVYLMYRTPTGQWFNMQDQEITSDLLPLDKATADQWALAWQSRERTDTSDRTDHNDPNDPGLQGTFTMNARLSFDRDGNPLLATTSGEYSRDFNGAYASNFLTFDPYTDVFIAPVSITGGLDIANFANSSVIYDTGDELQAFVTINGQILNGNRGGDMALYTSSDGGETWSLDDVLATYADTGLLYDGPLLVQDPVDEAYVIFFGRDPTGTRDDTHLFMYGSNGFVTTVVPEPASALVVTAGLGGLLLRRR
jgi:hypothetical protein